MTQSFAPSSLPGERLPYTGPSYLPVRLRRQATPPAGLRYKQFAFWEERSAGRVQRTNMEKDFTLAFDPATAQLVYCCLPPVLHKPSLSALERVLLLLAQLYQRLVLTVSPAGQPLAVRNHPEIVRAWEESIRPQLVRHTGGEDEVTRLLVAQVGERLQAPAHLLASLSYEYAFALLLPDCYEQRLESGQRYAYSQQFPLFFNEATLYFSGYLTLEPPPAAGLVALRVRGQLDLARTDGPAVARQVASLLAASGSPAPTPDPATLSGHYEASYLLDQATGWPVALEASAHCRAGEAYGKEYFIRLEQLPLA